MTFQYGSKKNGIEKNPTERRRIQIEIRERISGKSGGGGKKHSRFLARDFIVTITEGASSRADFDSLFDSLENRNAVSYDLRPLLAGVSYSIRRFLMSIDITLPAEPVGVGAQWRTTSNLKMLDGLLKWRFTTKTTLLEYEGGRVKLQVEFDGSAAGEKIGKDNAVLRVERLGMSGKGTYNLDLTKPAPIGVVKVATKLKGMGETNEGRAPVEFGMNLLMRIRPERNLTWMRPSRQYLSIVSELDRIENTKKEVDLAVILGPYVKKVPTRCGVYGRIRLIRAPVEVEGVPKSKLLPGVIIVVQPNKFSPCSEKLKAVACALSISSRGIRRKLFLNVKRLKLHASRAKEWKTTWNSLPRGSAMLTIESEHELCVECQEEEKMVARELVGYEYGSFDVLKRFYIEDRYSGTTRHDVTERSLKWFLVGRMIEDVLVVVSRHERGKCKRCPCHVVGFVTFYCFSRQNRTIEKCPDAVKRNAMKEPEIKSLVDSVKNKYKNRYEGEEDEYATYDNWLE